jgi:hypothetical protein
MRPAGRPVNNEADRTTLLDKRETVAQSIGPEAASTALPPPAVSYDATKLDKHLAGGIAWTTGAKWSSQVLSWASTLVVARLLLPSDFGLVSMGAEYLSLVQNFTEFGLSSCRHTAVRAHFPAGRDVGPGIHRRGPAGAERIDSDDRCGGRVEVALAPAWLLYLYFGMEMLTGGTTYVLVIVALHDDRLRAFKRVAQRLRS